MDFAMWPKYLMVFLKISHILKSPRSLVMRNSCCSVAQSCPTLCDPMDCSTTGFPVLHCPTVCSESSCPLSWWSHQTVSFSVFSFSSCLQPFSVSASFLMSQPFTSSGQSIGTSASASVLPMNIQDWFPLGWTGLISLLSKGLWRVFYNTTVQKHQFFGAQLSLWSNSHIRAWLLENQSFDSMDLGQ